MSWLCTSCPNSDVNVFTADKKVQTAFMWHRLLGKCWSRPKSGLLNLISSLELRGSLLFSEPLLVTVHLSIMVGHARAVVCCGRLASALTISKGKECPSSGWAPKGEIALKSFNSANLYEHASCNLQRSFPFQKSKLSGDTSAWRGSYLKLEMAKLGFFHP